jgi:hypothetical protein
MTFCLYGWEQTSNSLGGGKLSYVPDRLCYYPPSAAKPVIDSKHKLLHSPADLHLLVVSWRLRGIAYIYVWLESHPGQLAYTFLLVSYRRLSRQFTFSLSAVTPVYLTRWSSLSLQLRHQQTRTITFRDWVYKSNLPAWPILTSTKH